MREEVLVAVSSLLVIVVPAIPHLPGLDNNLPTHPNMARSTASYFTALAYTREPIQQFFYNTPHEGMSSIHLHSILSAPLVEAGYIEGGRLVSLIFGLVAIACLIEIGRTLWGDAAGIAMGVTPWLHLQFQTRVTTFQPEMLSIAMTSAPVLVTLKYLESDDPRHYRLLLAVLCLAPAIHLWEAVVLLPVAALLVTDEKSREAVSAVAVTVASVLLYFGITHLQPRSGSRLIEVYSIWSRQNWRHLLDASFWLPDLGLSVFVYAEHPIALVPLVSNSTLLIGVLIAVVAAVIGIWASWPRHTVLLASWAVAALSIPVALPRGYLAHSYYVWALIPVLAAAVGWTVDRYRRDMIVLFGRPTGAQLAWGVAFLLVLSSIWASGVYGDSSALAFSSEDRPSQEAAAELRDRGVTDPSRLVFVGSHTDELTAKNSFALRTLLYAQILVRTNTDLETGTGIEIVQSNEEFDGCEPGEIVIYHEGRLDVVEC